MRHLFSLLSTLRASYAFLSEDPPPEHSAHQNSFLMPNTVSTAPNTSKLNKSLPANPHWTNSSNSIINSEYFSPIFASTIATVLSHIFRIASYNTSNTDGFRETFKKTHLRDFHHGLPINWVRAITAMFLQASVKEKIAKRFDPKSPLGGTLGIFGVASMGALIASFPETGLIRYKKDVLRTQPYLIFSKNLSICYAKRELWFALLVFYKNEMPQHVYWPTLFVGTVVSAAFNKQATLLAREDIPMLEPGTTPNLNIDGWKKTAQKMMLGKYTHHSCKPFVANPTTNYHFMLNFLHSACPPHVFVFRAAVLYTCGAGIQYGKIYAEKIRTGNASVIKDLSHLIYQRGRTSIENLLNKTSRWMPGLFAKPTSVHKETKPPTNSIPKNLP